MPCMNAHPTALIHPDARIGDGVTAGPQVIVEAGAVIGAGCNLLPRCIIHSATVLGEGCIVHPNAILGGLPQDLKFDPATLTGVVVGNRTVIREGATIHRATRPGESTRVGSDCYLMAFSHIGHDCIVGNNVILANGALLGGHCFVGDRAFVSGNSGLHQFVRVGRLAFIGGVSRVTSNVPPFMMLELDSTIRNVNLIGLQRAGFTEAQIKAVKQAYRLLYHSQLGFRDALDRIEREIGTPEAMEIVEFCRVPSKRPHSRHYSR